MGSSGEGRLGLAAAALGVILGAAGCGGGGTLSGSGGAGVIVGGGGSGSSTGVGGGVGMNCGAHSVPVAKLPPDILIVLDTAASMNDPINGLPCLSSCVADSKWVAAVAAIDTVVDATAATANWGLIFMSSPGNVCDSGGLTIPVAPYRDLGTALAVRSNAGALAGAGNRPMRAAVNLAEAHLSGRSPGPHRIILLITDGLPNCAPGSTDFLLDDSEAVVRAVASGLIAGVTTAVVGLATAGGPADATLSDVATAGGLARAGSPTYYPASSTQDLVAALNTLVVDASACTFAVPEPPTTDGTTSRGDIEVTIDGRYIPLDPLNGWTYTDDSQLGFDLHGSACDAALAGTAAALNVVFPCHD